MRYLLNFSYDGTNYFGYAKQPNKISIQEEVETKLSTILNTEIKISASGRTDKGVHAINQFAHFDFKEEIDNEKVRHSLNKMLPNDIFIKSISNVDDNFHARFSASCKTYLYVIKIGDYDLFNRDREMNIYSLNIDKIIEASSLFIGEHNFQNFCSKNDDIDYVRNIFGIKIYQENSRIYLEFSGNGFMKYQVRKIVGTLIEFAKGKIDTDYIKNMLNKKERDIVPYTAEPQGLYLKDIRY